MSWTPEQQQTLLNNIRRRNERDILQKQVDRTKKEVADYQQEQTNLCNQWEREQADVDRLQRLSWASVWYDLLDKKEQQIDKEKAEAQQARLRYDAYSARVDALQAQQAEQTHRLADFISIDADYEQLIKGKRISFSLSLTEAGRQYQRYLADLTEQNRYSQELDEAHRAGLQALQEVINLGELLNQARSWGTWDLLGGSTITSAIKYRKLDDVRDQSYRVTRSLETFRAEYADLNQAFRANWQFDNNLTRFVDIFFDNIFTDWSVQSRINNALATAQALENQLTTAIIALKGQLEQSVEQTRQQSDELQHFLENA